MRAKYLPFLCEKDLLTIQLLDLEWGPVYRSAQALKGEIDTTLERVKTAIDSLEDQRDQPAQAATLVSGEEDDDEGLFGDIPATGTTQTQFSPAQERRLLR